MGSDRLLWRVGGAHGALVLALVFALVIFGHPVRGVLLGGSLIGFSFATFWIVARSITNPNRRGLAIVLGVIKVTLYLGLSAAVLSGRLVADADGFALGVSCFVVATLAAVFATHAPAAIRREARS
jgi:hypothetical protein